MKDFFAFRLMITAGLIKVIYPLGILVILALAGLFVILMPWMLEMSVFFTTQMLAKAAHIGQ